MRNNAVATQIPICDTPRVGRKLLYPDKIIAPLPPGSLARIEAVLSEGEDKTDLLRAAIEAELRLREKASPPKP